MVKNLFAALRATIVLAVFTGLLFPALITLVAQVIFPEQANGSLVRNSTGDIVGSKIIGQKFSKDIYFHSRPSAAGSGYAGEASAGTNLGPTSAKLIKGIPDDPATKDVDESYAGIKQLSDTYREKNLLAPGEYPPVDAVTRSASGLDPHISVANAIYQARRVSRARSMPLDQVIGLVHEQTEGRQMGIFGEPRVNALMLNLSLDLADRDQGRRATVR